MTLLFIKTTRWPNTNLTERDFDLYAVYRLFWKHVCNTVFKLKAPSDKVSFVSAEPVELYAFNILHSESFQIISSKWHQYKENVQKHIYVFPKGRFVSTDDIWQNSNNPYESANLA